MGLEREAHTLTPITRLRYPKRFVFFDSEARVEHFSEFRPDLERKPHRPRLVVSERWDTDGFGTYRPHGEAREFEGAALCREFWESVADSAEEAAGHARHGGSVVAIAHNVGYDTAATEGARHLADLGWTPAGLYEKGPVYIWRWSKNRRTLTLLSSTNFYAVKLSKLAETFGTSKLEIDTQTEDLELLRTYCRRDVAVVREAILGLVRFLSQGEIGPWAETISSVAFRAFRFRYMSAAIEIHTDPLALALERLGYFGGRTEAFFLATYAKLPLYLLDVNSLYPAMMLDRPYPTRLLGVREGGDAECRAALSSGALIVAEVTVEVPTPCVPLNDRERMKLLFPTGRFVTTLCTPELQLVEREGKIAQVHRWALYEGTPLFAGYVSELYAERLKAKARGEEARSQLFKNLLVNLYGKFGQRSEDWEDIGPHFGPDGVEEFMDLRDGRAYTVRYLGGRAFRCTASAEAYNSFPAIAAFVTSYGRVALWSAFMAAGGARAPHESHHVYYCDTDSLVVDDEGKRNLERFGMVDPNALGKLKLERTATERAIFYGAKAYEFDSYVRHKGIPQDARRRWDDGTEVRAGDGGRGAAFYYWPKTAGRLRSGEQGFSNRLIVKRLDVDYDKGERTPSGWVRPWVLDLKYPRGVIQSP